MLAGAFHPNDGAGGRMTSCYDGQCSKPLYVCARLTQLLSLLHEKAVTAAMIKYGIDVHVFEKPHNY